MIRDCFKFTSFIEIWNKCSSYMKPPMILLYMKSGNIIRGYLKDKDIFEGVTHNDVIDDVRKADIIGYNLLIVDKYNELGT